MQTVNTPVTATPQYTLKDAVLDAVNQLKSNGSLTAYDVTKEVRESANNGDYALPGLEAPVGSSYKYNVSHESVKSVINSLLNDGTLTLLGLTNVDYTGQYRTFNFSTADDGGNTATNGDVDGTDNDSTSDVVDTDGPVAQRIKTYLSNVGSATLKQVQSALKVNGLTCKDLATTLDELGYTVTEGTPGCYSTYTVE